MIQRHRLRWMLATAWLWTAGTQAQTTLPFKSEDGAKGWEAWLIVGVIAVLAVVIVAAKRRNAGSMRLLRRSDDAPRVMHSVALGVGSRLVEVEYRGERLLLGVTNSRVDLLKAGSAEAHRGDPE